jgi:phage terminase large subunit GpA-like protein
MRERNEALDCRVYARAAAARVGLDRFQEKHWRIVADRMGIPVEAQRPAPTQPPAPAPAPVQPRRSRRVSGRFRM